MSVSPLGVAVVPTKKMTIERKPYRAMLALTGERRQNVSLFFRFFFMSVYYAYMRLIRRFRENSDGSPSRISTLVAYNDYYSRIESDLPI